MAQRTTRFGLATGSGAGVAGSTVPLASFSGAERFGDGKGGRVEYSGGRSLGAIFPAGRFSANSAGASLTVPPIGLEPVVSSFAISLFNAVMIWLLTRGAISSSVSVLRMESRSVTSHWASVWPASPQIFTFEPRPRPVTMVVSNLWPGQLSTKDFSCVSSAGVPAPPKGSVTSWADAAVANRPRPITRKIARVVIFASRAKGLADRKAA